MTRGLITWWRALSQRERTLIAAALLLAGGVVAPALVYQSAAGYRVQAAGDLAAAQALAGEVQKITANGARGALALPANDGSLRGLVFAAAERHGLTIARVEAASGDHLRVVFEPAASTLIYRWFDTMARRGVMISRSALTRAGDGDLVNAEFELARTG